VHVKKNLRRASNARRAGLRKRPVMRHKANMKRARPQETQGEPACVGLYHPAICVWHSAALLSPNKDQSRHRTATVIQSDTKGEVTKRCTNNPLQSDSDGCECKYIFFVYTSRTAWDPFGSGGPSTMLGTVPLPWRAPPVARRFLLLKF
jgi:hypothetical protein